MSSDGFFAVWSPEGHGLDCYRTRGAATARMLALYAARLPRTPRMEEYRAHMAKDLVGRKGDAFAAGWRCGQMRMVPLDAP